MCVWYLVVTLSGSSIVAYQRAQPANSISSIVALLRTRRHAQQKGYVSFISNRTVCFRVSDGSSVSASSRSAALEYLILRSYSPYQRVPSAPHVFELFDILTLPRFF